MATAEHVSVAVQDDFVERQTRAKPIPALAELIWNGLDGDASTIRIEFAHDDLAGGLSKIVIYDDGEGFPRDVRPDEGFPWLQISLCKETGTNIFVQGMADFNEVNFGVYQPQGGSTWRRDFRALYDRISARWPTKIAFKNGQGEQTGPPEWATAEKPK